MKKDSNHTLMLIDYENRINFAFDDKIKRKVAVRLN